MNVPPDPHYSNPMPAVRSAPREVVAELADGPLRFDTDRGVFSHGRLDSGTEVLLGAAGPLPESGDLLDLGCGAGPLALTMARRRPGSTVWAVDINERAVERCAANAARLGLSNVRAVVPDGVPDEVRFAAIWSNPPIRIGKPALHELLTRWLGRLAPEGVAHLVVHKHLGSDSLARWLESEGWTVRRVASRGGYRLLDVAAS